MKIRVYVCVLSERIYRRSGSSLYCFLIRSNMVVYHWSSREMLSYSLIASVKPSMFCSSKCSHNSYSNRQKSKLQLWMNVSTNSIGHRMCNFNEPSLACIRASLGRLDIAGHTSPMHVEHSIDRRWDGKGQHGRNTPWRCISTMNSPNMNQRPDLGKKSHNLINKDEKVLVMDCIDVPARRFGWLFQSLRVEQRIEPLSTCTCWPNLLIPRLWNTRLLVRNVERHVATWKND